MKIYVAGPMRGYPLFNFPAFDAATEKLRDDGHSVFSPAEIDRGLGLDPSQPLPDWFTIEDAMRRDLAVITECDAIALLPGWETSEGVKHELAAARACGLIIYEYVDDKDTVTEDAVAPELVVSVPSFFELGDGSREAFLSSPTAETIVVDPVTGGKKGRKLARFSMLPWDVLRELAEHYGKGAAKYGDDNWRAGYAWSLNHDALHRHLEAWWDGEDTDPETGSSHLIAVVWHALALRWFQRHGRGLDDRPVTA